MAIVFQLLWNINGIQREIPLSFNGIYKVAVAYNFLLVYSIVIGIVEMLVPG
jgi:hypothetical protein